MYSKIYKYLLVFLLSGSYCKSIASPADSLFLTVDELFRLGVENSLKLQADKVQESMDTSRERQHVLHCYPTYR